MSTITKPYTFSAGAVIVAAEHNDNFDTIYNDYNGSITNANISASAAIADSKLASITTAGKVNVSALTVASQATGDLIYASSATGWTRLGIGTSTQILHGGTTPSFSAIAAADLLAGSSVQVVNTQTGAVATGTTTIPNDDTIPQNTEGTEFMTLAITPVSTTNKLRIVVVCYLSHPSDNAPLFVALFQDSTANALACAGQAQGSNGGQTGYAINFTHYMTAGTTSATTFKVRGGSSTAGTVSFNGASGSRQFGGVIASSITITEIKV